MENMVGKVVQRKVMVMIRRRMGLIVMALVPLAAMAQEGETRSLGTRLLEGVLPIVVIFGVLWLVMKKNRSYQQRVVEHMDRIEQKYDRIIELLAKLIEKDK